MADYLINKQIDAYYQYAEDKNSFASIVFSPYLLFRWQIKHPKPEAMRIATLASHRLGKHTWCTSTEKCATVEKFLIQHKNALPLPVIADHFCTKLTLTLGEILKKKIAKDNEMPF